MLMDYNIEGNVHPKHKQTTKSTKQWERTSRKGNTTKEWGDSQPKGNNLTPSWWTLRAIAILNNYKRP